MGGGGGTFAGRASTSLHAMGPLKLNFKLIEDLTHLLCMTFVLYFPNVIPCNPPILDEFPKLCKFH